MDQKLLYAVFIAIKILSLFSFTELYTVTGYFSKNFASCSLVHLVYKNKKTKQFVDSVRYGRKIRCISY